MISQIIFQESTIPTFIIDTNHIITHWNKSCERLTGLPERDMIGTRNQWKAYFAKEKPVMADLIIDNASKKEFFCHFGNGIQESSLVDGAYEAEGFFPDLGENGRWIFITSAPFKDDQGKNIGAVETLQDFTFSKRGEERLVEERIAEYASLNATLEKEITVRRQVEKELRLSEIKFRTIADFTYDWEYWIDPEGSFVYISPSCERITEYSTKEFMENSDLLASLTHPDDREKLLQHLKEEITADNMCHIDFRIITKKSEEKWISHFCQPVFDTDGSHLGRRASNRDISKRKQLEAGLRKEREELETRVQERTQELASAYSSLQKKVAERNRAYEDLQFTRYSIDHANELLYWVNSEGKIIDVNKTTCKRLGYEKDELLSMTVVDIDPSLTLDKYLDDWMILKQDRTMIVETTHQSKEGEVIPVEVHRNYIEFGGKGYNCAFARDITMRRELERLVAIQDKMGSLGRVAAGIAHEIRNPLSTINVYLSTLKSFFANTSFDTNNLASIQDAIAEMDNASHKVETVIKRVMDFSKPARHAMMLMDVNQCVKNAVDLSAVTLRKSEVMLELKLDEKLPECYLDSQLIEQMTMNFITNAIEELIDCQGKKQIEIRTAESSRNGKRFIALSVADSGQGVPPEQREKIFDPFFTTKDYGSGIGLSICHRIAKDHHGFIVVEKSHLGGTKFVAELPVKFQNEN